MHKLSLKQLKPYGILSAAVGFGKQEELQIGTTQLYSIPVSYRAIQN
jgi:hypothetical protein